MGQKYEKKLSSNIKVVKVIMFKHIINTGEEARRKFLNGAKKAGEIVGNTIGPKGRNVIIEEKYKFPTVHNDGVNIARKIVLEDPIEDLAYQTIVNVAMSQNEVVGDGTTTAVLLASKILEKGFEKINSDITGGDPVGMGEQIESEGIKAVELLKKESHELKKGELIDVITTSLRNRDFAKIIADMIEELGKDCYISVEDNWKTKYDISSEKITGIKKVGSYASPYFCNSKSAKEAIWEDTFVLVTNHKIESASHLAELLKGIQETGKLRLVIVSGSEEADRFSKPFLIKLLNVLQLAAKGQGDALQVLPIKAPGLTSEELEDIAVFTNARFIDKNTGIKLSDIRVTDLGYAKKVVVDEDDFLTMGGKGNTEERLKVLTKQLDLEKDTMFKEKLKRRISSLSAGAGIIRVGAITEAERSFKKMKIEDAVNTAKAALEEGIVQGGGLTLNKIADKLGKSSILYEPLRSINERIQFLANNSLKIGKEIVDATKVVRLAIESACSAASRVIAADTGVAKQRRTLWDELDQKLTSRDEQDDFRDDENQDLGNGRSLN